VTFFAGPDEAPDVKRRIQEDVLPRFLAMEGFLGFVALQSGDRRSEFVAMSFWSDGLETSEGVSEEFRDEIERVTGAAPTRREFDIVTLVLAIDDSLGSTKH
jgi:heme-degrading monooxygenase HmoA